MDIRGGDTLRSRRVLPTALQMNFDQNLRVTSSECIIGNQYGKKYCYHGICKDIEESKNMAWFTWSPKEEEKKMSENESYYKDRLEYAKDRCSKLEIELEDVRRKYYNAEVLRQRYEASLENQAKVRSEIEKKHHQEITELYKENQKLLRENSRLMALVIRKGNNARKRYLYKLHESQRRSGNRRKDL